MGLEDRKLNVCGSAKVIGLSYGSEIKILNHVLYSRNQLVSSVLRLPTTDHKRIRMTNKKAGLVLFNRNANACSPF